MSLVGNRPLVGPETGMKGEQKKSIPRVGEDFPPN